MGSLSQPSFLLLVSTSQLHTGSPQCPWPRVPSTVANPHHLEQLPVRPARLCFLAKHTGHKQQLQSGFKASGALRASPSPTWGPGGLRPGACAPSASAAMHALRTPMPRLLPLAFTSALSEQWRR